ncbi:fibronectin type III [Micromonospora radicis]|uniref:Fibronectin type III n=1 Tax=Micromonospora radicis TaxID=1894971 RepID=A0A418MZD2_9ACTN|nr:fibronectin type III [Micromonospora radicis]
MPATDPPPAPNRSAVVVAAVAVVVAIAAVVGAGVLLLGRQGEPPGVPGPTGPSASEPVAAGAPPTELELRDDSTTITLTWADPSDGLVPFMVAGGRAGQPLGVLATVEPGRTRYTVNGLSARVDYCFTVLAVYGTDRFATSSQVCTSREGDGDRD